LALLLARVSQITMFAGNKPRSLSHLCSTLGKAGVNILALYAPDTRGRGRVRVWVDRPEEAKAALTAAGVRFSEEEVVAMELDNKAGTFGEVAGRLGKANINIKYAYAATADGAAKSTVVMAVPDVTKAVRLLKKKGR